MTAIKSLLNGTGSTLKIGFKVFRFAFKSGLRIFFVLLLVGSIALNVAILLSQTVALAVGGVVKGITGVNTVVSSLVNKNNALNTRNAKLLENKAKIKNKTKGVSARVITGAKRKIASAPAKFVPVAGWVVVAGITGAELYDACNTMQDLKDINDLLDIDGASDDNTTIDPAEVCGLEIPTSGETVDETAPTEESEKPWWKFWGS